MLSFGYNQFQCQTRRNWIHSVKSVMKTMAVLKWCFSLLVRGGHHAPPAADFHCLWCRQVLVPGDAMHLGFLLSNSFIPILSEPMCHTPYTFGTTFSLTLPYRTFGVNSLLTRPFSAETILRSNPVCIPDVMKDTETSVKFYNETLQDSSSCKVQVPIMQYLITIMVLISML